jgi:hypothetical protein
MTNLKINTCPQTILINPVSENEVEKVVKNLKGKFSSGFDLPKAYDVADHNILLFKLDAYGIRGLVNQWFKSYLSNR